MNPEVQREPQYGGTGKHRGRGISKVTTGTTCGAQEPPNTGAALQNLWQPKHLQTRRAQSSSCPTSFSSPGCQQLRRNMLSSPTLSNYVRHRSTDKESTQRMGGSLAGVGTGKLRHYRVGKAELPRKNGGCHGLGPSMVFLLGYP